MNLRPPTSAVSGGHLIALGGQATRACAGSNPDPETQVPGNSAGRPEPTGPSASIPARLSRAIDGTASPGVQAGVPRTSPSKFGASINDCGGVSRGHKTAGASCLMTRSDRAGPQSPIGESPICPELTAYITTLLCVIGAVAWAHVYSMTETLEDEINQFNPRTVVCDFVGNRAEKLCAVRHKE